MSGDVEALAVYTAIMREVADEVKTGVPGNLRGRVDARMAQAYLESGAKSFDVTVNGSKVGTYSVRASSGPVVTDEEAFHAYLADCDMGERRTEVDLGSLSADEMDDLIDVMGARWPHALREFVDYPGAGGFLKCLSHDGTACVDPVTGAVVPGVEWRVRVDGGTLRGCSWDESTKDSVSVSEALGHRLSGGIAGLLGGSRS